MYKIKLTKTQIYTIYDMTDNKDKQSKLMSVLSYLIQHTKDNKLTKNLNRLYKAYIRLKHRKITRSYFYKLVDLLKEYKLFTVREDKTEDKMEDKNNITEPIESTGFNYNIEKHNNSTTNYTFTYTQYTSEDVCRAAEEILQSLNIKSKIIKQMVINKLSKSKIDTNGMLNYIHAVILDKVKLYYKARDKYKQKIVETRNTYNFNYPVKSNKHKAIPFIDNCQARAEYSDPNYYINLENRLVYGEL